MAKTILLDTRTANFLELIGNGKVYRVPPYQRDYSWKEEHWEDIWNDISEMRGHPGDRHYLGALVIEGITDRAFQIIDGQQRIATLSILALAVIKRLQDLADSGVDSEGNRERASALRNRFIGEKDPASLVESSKLFLNETDDAFFQDYLVQLRPPLNPRGLPRSNKLLWDCFQFFYKQLGTIPEFSTDGSVLAGLLNETVARQLLFILISVDDELNAYTVFETLNARGLELSSTDLLKNYLFSKVRVKADLRALQRRWRALIATVKQERFPEFLRYHLLCSHKKVRRTRLFKLVRKEVETPQAVFSLMGELESRAELFSALSSVTHEYWIENQPCKPFVRELNLFSVRQMTPLLFAAWEKFSSEDFARTLKLISVISFRHSIVSGLNTNQLEPIYHEASKAVLEGRATNPAGVFDILRPVYVPDDKFSQDFSALEIDTGGSRKRLVKYILAKLESYKSRKDCDPDTDPATIEHILPENPIEGWEESFSSDNWESHVYRLGNLTFLEPSLNRTIGNALYHEKIDAYSKSVYVQTKGLKTIAPEEWTPALLKKRQTEMGSDAAHVWRVDFS